MSRLDTFADWDSEFFGFPVARITQAFLSESELKCCLDEMSEQGVKLVYWGADDKGCEDAALHLGGQLVDHKVTFVRDILDNLPCEFNSKPISFQSKQPSEELIELAYLSGNYSRFKVDPKVGEERFKKLYRQWISNSTNRSLALDANQRSDVPIREVVQGSIDGRSGMLAIAKNVSQPSSG